jgi:Protein of unknown function (DUF2510)
MNAPAGWYLDPKNEIGIERWWDGERWTKRVRAGLGTTAWQGPRSIWRTVMITLAVVATVGAGLVVCLFVLLAASGFPMGNK